MNAALASPSTQPLRVAQFNTLFKGGGVDNQTLELAIGLRESGHTSWAAVPTDRPYEVIARKAGVCVWPVPARNRFKQVYEVARLLRNERIQILHAHHGRDYWTAILAARFCGRRVKVVLSRHLATSPKRGSRWFLLTGCDALITVSNAVDQSIHTEMLGNKAKIHRVYGGIDANAFSSVPTERVAAFRQQNGWAPGDVVCGVVGTFSFPRGKGQPEFLQAAQRLKPEFPNARFAIIGTGSMKSFLEQEIQTKGLDGIARLIPYSYEMPVIMNALDILVHPAVGAEALGLVLWEAMAASKPVIASRLGGIPEAFLENEHGLLVPPGDVEALTGALRQLLGNEHQRHQFGVKGCQHVHQHFARSLHARRMAEVYSALIFKSS